MFTPEQEEEWRNAPFMEMINGLNLQAKMVVTDYRVNKDGRTAFRWAILLSCPETLVVRTLIDIPPPPQNIPFTRDECFAFLFLATTQAAAAGTEEAFVATSISGGVSESHARAMWDMYDMCAEALLDTAREARFEFPEKPQDAEAFSLFWKKSCGAAGDDFLSRYKQALGQTAGTPILKMLQNVIFGHMMQIKADTSIPNDAPVQ